MYKRKKYQLIVLVFIMSFFGCYKGNNIPTQKKAGMGLLEGKVKYESGVAASGLVVNLINIKANDIETPTVQGKTDTKGALVNSEGGALELVPGKYNIYLKISSSSNVLKTDPVAIVAEVKEEGTSPLEIVIKAETGVISGVIQIDGTVAGNLVVLVLDSAGSVIAQGVTNASGEIKNTDGSELKVPSGSIYSLQVKNNEGSVLVQVPNIDVKTDDTVSASTSVVTGTLSGTVNSQGEALSNGVIIVVDASGNQVAMGKTGEDGKISSADGSPLKVPAGGPYTIIVKNSEGETVGTVTGVTINAGGNQEINAALQMGALEGTVLNSYGSPVVNAVVKVKDSNGNVIVTGKTDGAGKLIGAEGGKLSVPVGGPYQVEVISSNGQGSETSGSVNISNGDTINVDVRLAVGTLSGQVKTDSGESLAGASVVIQNSEGTVILQGKTDSNGNIVAADGSSPLLIAAGGPYSVLITGANNEGAVSFSGINISAGATSNQGVVAVIPPKGTLTGTVTDASGTAVSGAIVKVKNNNGDIIAEGVSGANGVILSSSGEAFLVKAGGAYAVEITLANGDKNRVEGIMIEEGKASSLGIVKVMPPTGTVSGSLSADATVTIKQADGTEQTTSTSTSNPDYTFENVPEGEATLEYESGGKTVTQEVQVNAGEETKTNPFGSTQELLNSLKAQIYEMESTAKSVNDIQIDKPLGDAFYSREINIPKRGFEDGFPGLTNRFEWFGVIYEGTITAPKTGEYTFWITCDDGGVVYINGSAIVNGDGKHAAKTYSGKISLTAGQKYQFMVKYFQGPRYNIALVLESQIPGGSRKLFSMNDFK